jgi:hypothetical protein
MSDMTDLAFFEKEPTAELVAENPTSRRGLSACDGAAGDVAYLELRHNLAYM